MPIEPGGFGFTNWSIPTNRPLFASPMYCSCLHHSLKPTRWKFRTVRKIPTMDEGEVMRDVANRTEQILGKQVRENQRHNLFQLSRRRLV